MTQHAIQQSAGAADGAGAANKPRWQRARFIAASPDMPEVLGAEVWVRIGPPQWRAGRSIEGDTPQQVAPSYTVHLTVGGVHQLGNAADLELLSRGPEDFAVEVPAETYHDWRARLLRRDAEPTP